MHCFLVFCLCFQIAILDAKIIEAPHFHHLSEHVDDEALVLLDIDDTLLIPPQMLGCDEWFQHRLNVHMGSGLDQRLALQNALMEWEAVRHITEMEIVELGSDQIVKELQEKSVCLMGLTTQGLTLASRTVHQLNRYQINLSLTAPSQDHHFFSVGSSGVLYANGILFTSGTCKGKAIFQLCDAIGYHPKKIVFINDKASHLAEIEREAHARNVEFVGLRYGYSDARKKAFRPEIAEYQFANSSFVKILSDEEAMKKIEGKN